MKENIKVPTVSGDYQPQVEITMNNGKYEEVYFFDDYYFVFDSANGKSCNAELKDMPEWRQKLIAEKRAEIDKLTEEIVSLLVHGEHFVPIIPLEEQTQEA